MTTAVNQAGFTHTARSGTNLTNFILNTFNGSAVPGVTPTINATAIGTTTPAQGSFTYLDQSVANALTAAGSSRTDALALTHAINKITTATSSTGVILPLVATVGLGAIVYIFNGGASPVQVYGAGSDTIDTVAAATGVPLTNAKRAMFVAVAAATWISAQLGVVSA